MHEVNRHIWVWQNDTWQPAPATPAATLTLRERVQLAQRANGEWCLFRALEHAQRLLQSARRIGFAPPATASDLTIATALVVRTLLEQAAPVLSPGQARVLFTLHSHTEDELVEYGDALSTRCVLALEIRALPSAGFPLLPSYKALLPAVQVAFSSEEATATSALSNLTRNPAWLAHRTAQRNGCFTALLRDPLGRVSGAAFASVFCVGGQRVFTPHLASGAFPGLTRDTLLLLAEESGFCVTEQEITREMLLRSSEVFLASTGYGIVPVQRVDGIEMPASAPGNVTRRLSELYADVLLGTDANHPEWLCSV
jgi:branched-subunit amino acid aminotransferase/4-amino-4-deoxychorismate lyase